ncbi:hypothetical protein HMPREF1861_00441 [Corynebacterium kroppenstedtii]|nr:hypothetical protein HMPREF1861_00441 [Corynebacterium kroppenstedtii]
MVGTVSSSALWEAVTDGALPVIHRVIVIHSVRSFALVSAVMVRH